MATALRAAAVISCTNARGTINIDAQSNKLIALYRRVPHNAKRALDKPISTEIGCDISIRHRVYDVSPLLSLFLTLRCHRVTTRIFARSNTRAAIWRLLSARLNVCHRAAAVICQHYLLHNTIFSCASTSAAINGADYRAATASTATAA